MLDKIANIELNSSGRNARNTYRKAKFGEVLTAHNINKKDSLIINPAFRLITHYGGALKELDKHPSGSLKAIFQFNEFMFEVKLDTGILISDNAIEYDIWEDEKFNPESFRVFLKTQTAFTDKFTEIDEITLDGLRFFFRRCKDLDIKKEMNPENTLAINNLLDKIYTKMIDEFSIVNSVIVRFGDLLNGTKMLSKLMEEHKFNELILVKRIVPKHGNDN